jgi:hypothetical protein
VTYGLLALSVHEWLAWCTVIANGVVGAWAVGAHWLVALRHRALLWCTAVAQLTMFLQVALGVYLIAGPNGLAAPDFHLFYGFIALVAIAIIVGYRNQVAHWLYLLYGFGGLFVMGLGIRSMTLA